MMYGLLAVPLPVMPGNAATAASEPRATAPWGIFDEDAGIDAGWYSTGDEAIVLGVAFGTNNTIPASTSKHAMENATAFARGDGDDDRVMVTSLHDGMA